MHLYSDMNKQNFTLAGQIFLAVLITSAALSACKKDKDNPAPTELQLLTQHDWRMGHIYYYDGGMLDDSVSGACELDDLYRFHPTKFVVLDKGIKCDSTEPDSTVLDMVYPGNHTFTVLADGDSTKFSITKVTSDVLDFEGTQDGETLKAHFIR